MTREAWTEWVRRAEHEVARTLEQLPERLRSAASAVPVTCEKRPSRAMIRDGVEHDTMGLFVGLPYGDALGGGEALPPHVILFLDVILEEVDGDEAGFRREVRQTYLHELGHYLGLDEEGLEERDLG